jgi:hypothetical protein
MAIPENRIGRAIAQARLPCLSSMVQSELRFVFRLKIGFERFSDVTNLEVSDWRTASRPIRPIGTSYPF